MLWWQDGSDRRRVVERRRSWEADHLTLRGTAYGVVRLCGCRGVWRGKRHLAVVSGLMACWAVAGLAEDPGIACLRWSVLQLQLRATSWPGGLQLLRTPACNCCLGTQALY